MKGIEIQKLVFCLDRNEDVKLDICEECQFNEGVTMDEVACNYEGEG